jgi:trehalose-phosphatase
MAPQAFAALLGRGEVCDALLGKILPVGGRMAATGSTILPSGGRLMSKPFFDAIHEVSERIFQASQLLLCLDYDGTLTGFVDNPMGASLSPHMERVLSSLAEHDTVKVAIISGRERADLQTRIDVPGLIYAGNHGLEISGPGFVFIEPSAAAHTDLLKTLAADLTAKLQGIEGALVEYKGLTLSVHYRQVAPDKWEEVRHIVHGKLASESYPFVLTTGEMVFEIRPRVYWNKGTAVNWLRERLGKPGLLTIFVGGELTDAEVFKALASDDITVSVHSDSETVAQYTLEGPSEVRKLLEWVDDWQRHRKLHSETLARGPHGSPATSYHEQR